MFDLIIRLRVVMTVNTQLLVSHALLFQRIFADEYKRLSSLLTIRRLVVSKQL